MLAAENLLTSHISIVFAALGLAAVLAARDWRFSLAIDSLSEEDGRQLSPKLEQLKDLQRMTEIADEAIAARRRQQHFERVQPEGFGRNKPKKKPIIDRR